MQNEKKMLHLRFRHFHVYSLVCSVWLLFIPKNAQYMNVLNEKDGKANLTSA